MFVETEITESTELGAGYAYLRYGDHPGQRSLGAGMETSGLWQRDHPSLDIKIDAWQQPAMELTSSQAPGKEGLAVLLWLRRRVGDKFWLLAGAGAKTEGFVMGEPLEAGPILRLGLAFTAPKT